MNKHYLDAQENTSSLKVQFWNWLNILLQIINCTSISYNITTRQTSIELVSIICGNKCYHSLNIIYPIFKLQVFLFYDQLTYFNSQRIHVKFHLRNYYGYNFLDYVSLGSPEGTSCLNSMRYYGAFIENTWFHQLSSIVT